MRSRNIKPGFFKNELLGMEDPYVSLTFIGLWCIADREGILEDRPLRIKAEIFPYREKIDINRYLTVLSRLGFIQSYKVNGVGYIKIVNFTKHQLVHHTEKASVFPKPSMSQTQENKEDTTNNGDLTVGSPLNNGDLTVGSPLNNGGNPSDNLNTDNLNTDKHEKRKRVFITPSLEEVEKYVLENNYHVDAKEFLKYFTESNWIDSKGNKVRSWKQKIITWENLRIGHAKTEKTCTICGTTTAKDYLKSEKGLLCRFCYINRQGVVL